MYHYVRDSEGSDAPGINAVRTSDFCRQLDMLGSRFEFVGLDDALAYLRGEVQVKRPLCCLTFDDGLVEHAGFVTNELAARGIEGQFFLPTACIDRSVILPVHKNHLLMGRLAFDDYRAGVHEFLARNHPELPVEMDETKVAATYRWDTKPVASLKYLINYGLPLAVRDALLTAVFTDVYGDESRYADKFYLSWTAARAMQERGMKIGGHTHRHPVLSRLPDAAQTEELEACTQRLDSGLGADPSRPFCYPYGKAATFNAHTVRELKRLGFNCAFSTEVGHSEPGTDLYSIRRIDPKDIPRTVEAGASQ